MVKGDEKIFTKVNWAFDRALIELFAIDKLTYYLSPSSVQHLAMNELECRSEVGRIQLWLEAWSSHVLSNNANSKILCDPCKNVYICCGCLQFFYFCFVEVKHKNDRALFITKSLLSLRLFNHLMKPGAKVSTCQFYT
uniref:Uncharacterized protein n=1 Tax=Schistocephalus solidus TaxID=70667 RepID=A0A0X3NKY7_SCHSO